MKNFWQYCHFFSVDGTYFRDLNPISLETYHNLTDLDTLSQDTI